MSGTPPFRSLDQPLYVDVLLTPPSVLCAWSRVLVAWLLFVSVAIS